MPSFDQSRTGRMPPCLGAGEGGSQPGTPGRPPLLAPPPSMAVGVRSGEGGPDGGPSSIVCTAPALIRPSPSPATSPATVAAIPPRLTRTPEGGRHWVSGGVGAPADTDAPGA